MHFWSGITTLAVLGIWGLQASKAQVGEKGDVEEILATAVRIQQNLLDKFEIDGVSTSNCLIHGIKSRNIDILQLKKLANSLKTKTDIKCNSLEHEWKYDFRDAFEPEDIPIPLETLLSTTCGKYPSSVWTAVQNGQTLLTKKIVTGLLSTVQPNITTPDAITLLENSAKIIENANVTPFQLNQEDVLFEIGREVMNQNHLQPNENYQLTEMAAAQDCIKPNPNFSIFSIIRPNTFPKDVVSASEVISQAIVEGNIEGCSENGWTTPPEQLLALTTSLTTISNNHPLAPSVHVLYSHVRMWYFCLHGYQYVPKTFNDIVFLLNSFLTIRNPTLLREVYLEFSKIPWQDYTASVDFSRYCDPRSLMTDIVKSILDHPNSLKICNNILLNYFINADEDCPHWLKPIFSNNSTSPPLEVMLPLGKPRLTTTTTEMPVTTANSLECEEGDTKIIEPESLLAIFDSKKHQVVTEIIKENPFPADMVPYNSREGVFKYIIDYLLNTRKDYSNLKKRALKFAARDLKLNAKKTLPVEHGCVCLVDSADVPTTCREGETKTINPESLIEIFDSSSYPLLVKFLRDHPSEGLVDSKTRLAELTNILRKFINYSAISEELRAIFRLFLGPNPPINQKGSLAVTWKCTNKVEPKNVCNLVSVINQDSLISIINEKELNAIKNVVYLEPVFVNDYYELQTREEILKKVLEDRMIKLNDDVMEVILSQAIDRMLISWQGMLPPLIDEICENDLKYNITFSNAPLQDPREEDVSPAKNCDSVTAINQQSLMDIISEERINLFKTLVYMEPVLFSDYGKLQSREEILRKVLYDRMLIVNDDIMNSVVPMALDRMTINWRGMLPPEIQEICKRDLVYNTVTPATIFEDEDSIADEPECGENMEAAMIADTNSLFDALDKTAPRATVIRQKVRSFVYRVFNRRELRSHVLRNILLSLREEIANPRLVYEIDQLLITIRYDGNGMEPVVTNYVCLDKNRECRVGENLMEVVEVKPLLDAFKENTLVPMYIHDNILNYQVPADRSKSYQKGEILRQILEDMAEDALDSKVKKQILGLIRSIRTNGAALEDVTYVLQCLSEDEIPEPPCDEDEAKKRPIREGEDLETKNSSTNPGQEILEFKKEPKESLTSTPPYLKEAEEISEECDDSNEDTTIAPQNFDYWEESTEMTTPEVIVNPTLTTITSTEPFWAATTPNKFKVTPKPEVVFTTPKYNWKPEPVQTSEEYSEDFSSDDMPIASAEATGVDSLEDCEDSEEAPVVPPPTFAPESLIKFTDITTETPKIMTSKPTTVGVPFIPSTTPAEVNDESIECEDSKEVAADTSDSEQFAEPDTSSTIINEDVENCDEEPETTTTEAPTTEPTTPEASGFGRLCQNWPLLLKVNLEETCFDEKSLTRTHPIDVVTVNELLTDAEGTNEEKYITSAKLAGLDTYESLRTFDWDEFCTRAEFFNALMQHLGFDTSIVQRSSKPVTINTICRKQLFDALPKMSRTKREAVDNSDGIIKEAMTLAKSFMK